MTAAEVLGRAVLELAERHLTTPCQGRRRDRWTSESAEDRASAAAVCVGLNCPVLLECRAAAAENGEKHHVWGGSTAPPRPRGRSQRDRQAQQSPAG